MYYIASCSFGKDSLAMVLRLIEENKPLDEVVFYDTGMEFQAIYNVRDRLLPLLYERGIKYTELKPKVKMEEMMTSYPINGRNGVHYGYGWCGGACRWGTGEKLSTLEKYQKDKIAYCGIAVDEEKRLLKERKDNVRFPLAECGMTEKDCLEYCHEKGYFWEENGIELYSILDRVSCWCCCNKNKKELYNIYRYLPQYWERLKDLQSKIDRPMKKFCNKQYGEYGNVFEMEKVFEKMQ